VVVDQYAARSDRVLGKGASSTLSFTADRRGDFTYFCSVRGHRAAGMQGRVEVAPDHALSRLERGLVGFLIVDGPRDDDLMHEGPAKR
jgi:Copper binding proteins, plastocyanin/azurin family